MVVGKVGILLCVGFPGSAMMNAFSVTTAIVWRKKDRSEAYPGIERVEKRRKGAEGEVLGWVCRGSSNVSMVWWEFLERSK
jgi:hypothetical protein